MPPPATIGIIVNPLAGKDIRRLVSAASHTSDSAKIGIVRRVMSAAAEAGVSRILVADDPHHLAGRAARDVDLPVELVDEEVTGSRSDTVMAASRFWKEGVGAVVVLGGDGTCRDVAAGWPDAPLIAISTGTNNVYPSALDGTSAGAAAGLVALGAVCFDDVARRTKRVSVRATDGYGHPFDDLALVDLALVDTAFTGTRAVQDHHSIRWVVAAVATPASTGLSSIAGRLHPCGRWEPGGVVLRLGPGGRSVRVPLSPGSFTTVAVAEVRPVADGETVLLRGPGVLAFDGERDRRIDDVVVEAVVDRTGPFLIDVERTLVLAAADHRFDVTHSSPEDANAH